MSYETLLAMQQSLAGRRMERFEYLKCCADALGLKVRRLAEIGVHRGDASAMFCQFFPEATLFLIDPWEMYDDYRDRKSGNVYKGSSPEKQDARCDAAYRQVLERFDGNPQVRILRTTSLRAAAELTQPMDLVFLDGNHAYPYICEDIQAWLPQVRVGGMLSGHDYKAMSGVKQAVHELLHPVVASGRNKGDVWVFFKAAG